MTEMSAEYKALAEYRPTQKVRFVTAASLFDGHDAAITSGSACEISEPKSRVASERM